MSPFRMTTMIVACELSLFAVNCARAQDTLVWSDEFAGTTIDPANWEHQIGGGGWGNNEWEYYTDRPENSFVAGGYLHIVARQESYNGSDYTSARMRTQHKQDFRYGRLEARIKLPSGQGIWPAFWMMPSDAVYGGWAASGEIDILEAINIPNTVYGTLHYGGGWPNNTSSGGSYADGGDFSDDFHVYTLEWEPDVMRWYVDGVWYHTETSATWYTNAAPGNPRAPFDQYFHFILNIAVGGNWPGYPDGSTVFPQEMLVDWVRVYDLDIEPQAPFYGDPLPIAGRIEAEDFDTGFDGVAYHDCDTVNNGGAYRPGAGVDIEPCSEGGFNIGWMCSGEWIEYTVDVARAGRYVVEARVASEGTGGQFRIAMDGVDVSGDIVVPATGGWQNWVTVSTAVELPTGEQVMRFSNTALASDEYNVNYFDFFSRCDFDRDHDVDIDDVRTFLGCMAGPENSVDSGCDPADLDGDGDVDVADYYELQAAVTGS